MQTTGLLGNACCLLLVSQAETPILALLLTSGVMGFIGFCFSGYAANPLDLSPKYADVLVGISNTFGTLPGVFGVLVTGVIVDRTGSYIAAFLLAAGISVVGALVFLVLGSGKQVID
jgi:ACS family sodium-dependent inorganic phosphate cotransporter